MQTINEIAEEVPYHNKRELLVQDHSTGDIVKAIKKYHGRYSDDYDKIAKDFWDGSPEATTRRIFSFLKKNIRYDIEPESYQTVKSPGAIVKEGHGDCKHYASFITGICCSLERQGYPVHARYRFVSDSPGKEIHHVFAVVNDNETGKEFWVDPVLKRFDEQPEFYNVKDANMSKIGELYAISGIHTEDTYPGGPLNLPQIWGSGVGKKKKGNIFKRIAHGLQTDVKNAGKDIKKVADKVKTLALKVSLAAARDPFLALVDFNMFNLAKHLHETLNGPDAGKLKDKWTSMGGNPAKLISAVNNGVKNYNKHHGAKITGFNSSMGHIKRLAVNVNFYMHPTLGRLPIRMLHMLPHPEHRIYEWNARHLPRSIRGIDSNIIACGCNGRAIGCLPVCAPALIALAAAIVAALKGFIHSTPAEQAAMAGHIQAGVANLVTAASDGIDASNGNNGAAAATAITQAATSAAGSISMSAGTDPATGQPTLQVNSVTSPVVNQAGQPTDDHGNTITPAAADAAVTAPTATLDPTASTLPATTDPTAITPSATTTTTDTTKDKKGAKGGGSSTDVSKKLDDFLAPIETQIKEVWTEHKQAILGLATLFMAYKIHNRRGRRKGSIF